MGLISKNNKREKEEKNTVRKDMEIKAKFKAIIKKTFTYIKKIKPGKLDPVKSVGARLFLIFFIAIMFFVIALGILSYQTARNTIQDNARFSNQQTVIQTSQKLDIIFKQYEANLLMMFFDQEVQNDIGDLKGSNDEYNHFLLMKAISQKMTNYIYSTQGAQAVYLASVSHVFNPISAGTPDTNFVSTLEQQPWYKDLSADSSSLWVPVSNDQGGTIFRYIQSFKTTTGTERYIVALDINLNVLTDQLDQVSLGQGSKVQLITNSGQIVASNLEDENGTRTAFQAIAKDTSNTDSLTTKDEEGKSVLAVYNTLEVPGWKLVGIVPVDNLVADAKQIMRTTYLSAIIVAVIAILIGMWMVRMIARPLAKMNTLMQEGAMGNLNVRMKHAGRDEIGQLSGSFNKMMEQITELVTHANNSSIEVLATASELADASRKTALSAKEIAVATEEIAKGATSLAAEAERGSDLTENIGTQVSEVIASNKEMQDSARQVEQASELGTRYLQGLTQKTNITGEMTRALADRVNSLHASSTSVLKVLDVMQNITQQTNILSLNATIEAARAGAAGRGFMVVADEIRQLAEQSKQSITMVGQIADQIQQEMNETIKALEEVNPLFEQQIQSVKETGEIFVSVQEQMNIFVAKLDMATASIEGLSKSQNILSEAMTNVSAVAEESSATSEEVASLSSEQQMIGDQLVQLSGKLEDVSDQLKDSLSRFKI
ncbi:methyl-accepting chemotaxis protein [Paenibacillus caui]|uniref:methyl-accepting chemotaxis protein n=1 Tax=Paenibacillus caui TaxID=2873927 RepID=UPI001CA872D6|nr:methyl-accepting chemotaxis protein [Paenibacillus caui]